MTEVMDAGSDRIGTDGHHSRNRDWMRPVARLFGAWGTVVALIGGLLLMGGTIIDLSGHEYPEVSKLLITCAPPDAHVQCREAVFEFDQHSHQTTQFNLWRVIAETLKTVGLTMIASVVIAGTVERRTRRHFFQELSQKTEQLGSNVMTGMFNRLHPPRVLELVKREILERDLIRSHLSILYSLSLWQPPDPLGRLASRKFVKVDVIFNSTIRNVSSIQDPRLGRAKVRAGLALPNPLINELKEGVRLHGFQIGKKKLSAAELERVNAELQEKLQDDEKPDASFELDAVEIGYGESIQVSCTYCMIKECEDTEVFRTLQIAESLHLTVVDQTGLNLEVRARAISHGNLVHQPSSEGNNQWQLDDMVLPQQGIMVWWKKPLPDLAPPNAAPQHAGVGDPLTADQAAVTNAPDAGKS